MWIALCILSIGNAAGQDPSTEDTDRLIQMLGAEDLPKREESAAALRKLGRPALPALEKAAADPDPEVARRVRDLLQAIRRDFLRAVEERFDGARPARLRSRYRVEFRDGGDACHIEGTCALDLAPGRRLSLRLARLDSRDGPDPPVRITADGRRLQHADEDRGTSSIDVPEHLHAELAQALGRCGVVAWAVVSGYVRGRQNPDAESLEDLCRVMGRLALLDVREGPPEDGKAVLLCRLAQDDRAALALESTLVYDEKMGALVRRTTVVREGAAAITVRETYETTTVGDARPGALFDLQAIEQAARHRRDAERRSRAGDLPGALDEARKAVDVDPVDAQARSVLGALRARSLDLPGAEEALSASLELDPYDVHALASRGRARADRGRLEDAARDLLRAVALDPRAAHAWVELGRVRRLAGDPAAALEAQDRALRVEAHSSVALLERGRVHRLQGDLEAAGRDFMASLEARPESAHARFELGCLAFDHGDREKALAHLEKAAGTPSDIRGSALARLFHLKAPVEVDPSDDPWSARILACLEGRTAEDALLEAARHPEPEVARRRLAEARLHLGLRRRAAGDAAAARAHFQACLEAGRPGEASTLGAAAALGRIDKDR